MLWLGLLLGCGASDDTAVADPFVPEEIGRCVAFTPTRMALFGDTHIHTALSLDASLQGTRLRPADAYRFAKGAEVGIQPYDAQGNSLRSVRLERPLDWAAVSDHAEFLGLVHICSTPGTAGYDDAICAGYRDNPDASFFSLNILLAADENDAHPPALCDLDGVDCDAASALAWQEVRDAAEGAYDTTSACQFTSFVGYEWSSNPGAFNLHRNVIFRNDRVPDVPIGYLDEPHVEDLWARLYDECLDELAGCDVLTIPHNSNLSGGLMFEGLDKSGLPIDNEYATIRAAMEPLVEIFQHKGDSECWTGSLAGDELCGFEYLPYNNLANANLDLGGEPEPRDFVRDALGRGLELQQTLGVNPYKYGIVASTDTHLGTPGLVEESTFPGHGGAGQANRDGLPVGLPDLVAFNPGGLAVVWAEENSREAIWAAMQRREAYGTSGPRITLRMFAGHDLSEQMCTDPEFAASGYATGVPMGADLPAGDGPMRLSIAALRDASNNPGTKLQRIQVVKGWTGASGVQFEVYDVAGDPTVGSGFDAGTCAPTGEGFDDLCTTWTDPDFDPSVAAFWYVRVLEVPTCRWSQQQCVAASIDCAGPVPDDFAGCCDARVEPTIQERAWSSPVWYVPTG